MKYCVMRYYKIICFAWIIVFLSCANKQIIRPKIDISEVLRLQQSVNQGHQSWRLDPVMVAGVYLRSLDAEIEDWDCRLVGLSGNKAIVTCDKRKHYVVTMETLLSHEGIWTVTSVEIIDEKMNE